MHCEAVVFIEFPDGRRIWLPADSDTARIFRRGPAGGPRPLPSHGVCRACVHEHYPELLPTLRARFPASGY